MYRKILLGGAVAAVIVGAGGTAMAVTGSSTTNGTPSSSSSSSSSGTHSSAHHAKKGDKHKSPLKHVEHGQFVTRGKDGKTVTHDIVRGTVTAVSSSSITVQAADKTSETYSVTKDTKVKVRKDGKATDSTISSVAKGDKAVVTGTGTSSLTANHIAAGAAK